MAMVHDGGRDGEATYEPTEAERAWAAAEFGEGDPGHDLDGPGGEDDDGGEGEWDPADPGYLRWLLSGEGVERG